MKKISLFILMLFSIIFLSGCGKSNEEDIVQNFIKKIKDSNSYYIEGTFELINNEEKYTYDINVYYKESENFKVKLINKTNNHEQVILRNLDGVYVLTPSLNKSFKFQSEWPYNNSQAYILQSLIKDIEDDSDYEFQTTNDGYIITTSVNYSSKPDLIKQNIYLDKNKNIIKVETLDLNNQPKIIMNFSKLDYNSNLSDDEFILEKITSNEIETDTPVSSIDGYIFPMYLPDNTYLTGQDVVSIDGGERAILTFNGEKPFTVIQETINSNDLLSENVEGDPQLIMDSIGVISDSSVSWISNGVEYYVISENLSQSELLNVANSISVMPVMK